MVIWAKMITTDKERFFGRQMILLRQRLPRTRKVIRMKLAIIEAIGLAAMFIIAAAVSYNSGYVGGRVDGLAEHNSAIRTTEGGAK